MIHSFCIAQTIKPYLQAATPNSIYVNWKTDNGTNPTIIYGTDATNLNLSATGTTVNLEPKDSDYHTPYHYHTIKLTGLTPNTGYYYKASSGTNDVSDIHYFKTPPALGDSSGVLRFIALGDHQLINYNGKPYMKFNELVQASKAKAEELYGSPLADHFNLIMNDGDQVDYGKLEHYEKIHFEKTSYITPDLPLITAVGNHEVYGGSYQNGALQAYYDHFVLDDNFSYGGINSGTERYYAYQMANVLFMVFDTELQSTTQQNWATDVINYAKTDSNIGWIISIAHRPYQAEQYSNDYSAWFANTIVPILHSTEKYALHMAGHHHMYARGQFKNHNSYHIISGGTAWPQYWGDSVNEDDREETQGSWSNFAYQFIEINNITNELSLKSYTIGSLTTTKDSELLDEFKYKRGVAAPDQPTITNTIEASINLPFTFNSSPYATTSSEVLNSTQYQIASTNDFSIIDIDSFRHVDNYYGPGATTDETVNIGLGEGILNYTIPEYFLSNGTYYARVRHRDANLGWSPWSDSIEFTIENSNDGEPLIYLDKPSYHVNEDIEITFINGPGGNQDWIGIYNDGDVPGPDLSEAYQYVNGASSGIKTFNISNSGIYYAAMFINNGYEEIVDRVSFWVGDIPTLSSNQTAYNDGDDVTITYKNHPNNSSDWIGIYKVGVDAGSGNEITSIPVNTSSDHVTFSGLPNAYYYAVYHVEGSDLIAGEQINFQIGDEIANISLSKNTFSQGEPITINFTDAPGIEKDYIGVIIDDGNSAGTENLWSYKYFGGLTEGTTTITGTEFVQGGPNQLPKAGNYYLAMFTNDSYTQVSNAIPITITNTPAIYLDSNIVNQDEPFDVHFVNAPGNTNDWLGIYFDGQTPSGVTSQDWSYINSEINGARRFTLTNGGEYFVALFENDGYNELANRIAFKVRATPILSSSQSIFDETDDVNIELTSGGLANVTDWIGVYKSGTEPSPSTLVARFDVTSIPQTFNFGVLQEGAYYTVYHTNGSYNEFGSREPFQIGNQIVTLSTNSTDYYLGDAITFSLSNGTGDNEDYIAVFPSGSNPEVDSHYTFLNLGDTANGSVELNGTTGNSEDENTLPVDAGTYFAVVMDPTSGEEISNRVSFTKTAKPTTTMAVNEVNINEDLTVNYANGPGNLTDWIGVYEVGQTPGGAGVYSTTWDYVDNANPNTGTITLEGINRTGDYYLALFEDDGYHELSNKFYFSVVDSTLDMDDVSEKTNKITIYPNPTLGIAYIKSDFKIEAVEVYNVNGKLVSVQNQINLTSATLNLKSVNRGMYFVKVKTNGLWNTIKLTLK
ncbi:fibronectin type III domain-containing protein [Pseudotamlana agarivorans]|uniref:fibronectin type III domain-containing protein n=1 Tax=Pseudotamlana agarivorans TaxID=481183 RepID=UPI000ABF83F7|nr:fibronectin type III domain-containing protein [Tamlana agarivorans]